MSDLLKVSLIIFLCLLLVERNAFSDHYKFFEDDVEKPITKKIIIHKPKKDISFQKLILYKTI